MMAMQSLPRAVLKILSGASTGCTARHRKDTTSISLDDADGLTPESREILSTKCGWLSLPLSLHQKAERENNMSFDVSLEQDGEVVQVKRHQEGGTYAVGGTTEAALNVTYNYSWFYFRFLDEDFGLRWLNGRKASDCIESLEAAVAKLGTCPYQKDYWAPTPGNAGRALYTLLKWAQQHPNATFVVE